MVSLGFFAAILFHTAVVWVRELLETASVHGTVLAKFGYLRNLDCIAAAMQRNVCEWLEVSKEVLVQQNWVKACIEGLEQVEVGLFSF